jgi:hypothetical protein
MGSFTSDELLYICQAMNCYVNPELVGVQKRTDIMKILREFIQTETGGNIQGNLNLELRLIARRGVGSKTPKIKESVRGSAGGAAAASAAEPDLEEMDPEVIQQLAQDLQPYAEDIITRMQALANKNKQELWQNSRKHCKAMILQI